jgi:hypothetical protein
MIPTTTEVLTDVRELLEDPNGTRWNTNTLRPHLQTAWSEIYAQALANELALLYPATAGIANMGEPTALYERGFLAANSIAITSIEIAPTTHIATVVTATAHPFVSGNFVTLHGVTGLSDDINDVFMIERINSTSFYIRGVTATGAHTASTGTATYSTESFVEMTGPVDDRYFTEATVPSSQLLYWKWDRDRFRFPGCSATRQIKITFRLSDSLPTDVSVGLGIDGSLPFLKHRVAGLALMNTAPATGNIFNGLALGPSLQAKDLGGFLGDLLRPQLRTSQRLPVYRPPFRRKRSTGPLTMTGYY